MTREDATRAIYSAFFVEEAGTLSRVHGGREVIEATGLFRSRYPDRGSHSRHTAAAGGCGDTIRLTPVHRAVHQVGITRLPAYSPEARGRSKRRVRTLQDRRPQERALAGLTERAAANRSRRECVLPQSSDRTGPRLHPGDRDAPRRQAVCARRTGRGPGQHGARSAHDAADSPRHAPVPCCDGPGPAARLSERHPGRVAWASVWGPLPCGGPTD